MQISKLKAHAHLSLDVVKQHVQKQTPSPAARQHLLSGSIYLMLLLLEPQAIFMFKISLVTTYVSSKDKQITQFSTTQAPSAEISCPYIYSYRVLCS